MSRRVLARLAAVALVAAAVFGTVAGWQPDVRFVIPGDTGPTPCGFTADGARLVVARRVAAFPDNRVRFETWDVERCGPLSAPDVVVRPPGIHDSGVHPLSLSPDGRQLLASWMRPDGTGSSPSASGILIDLLAGTADDAAVRPSRGPSGSVITRTAGS